MRRKVILFAVALAAILGLSATADAVTPYKFDQRTDPQCQAEPNQPFCQGSH